VNQYQDVTEIVDVDAHVDAIPVLFLTATDVDQTIAAYGLSFFLSSVEDVAVTLSAVMDAAATTVVSGLSSFSSSVEDAVTIHLVITDAATDVVATIAANKRNFEDGYDRPFCIPSFFFRRHKSLDCII